MPQAAAEDQKWAAWMWKISVGEIAAFEPLAPDPDLRRPVSIVTDFAHQFLLNPFHAP
jgi:hypothetical protein